MSRSTLSLRLLVTALGVGATLLCARSTGADEHELKVAEAARPSVVRVRWRDMHLPTITAARNAVIVRKDGLLLMAGPPPSRHGTIAVTLYDGREMRARLVAGDAQTALSILRVPTTGLVPVKVPPPPSATHAHPVATNAGFAPRPLAMPRLGTRAVMVTGDGAVALGAVRSWGHHGTVLDPTSRRRVRTTGLFAAAMAAVDTDAGSPVLDRDGTLLGLMVGRRATKAPERGVPPPRGGLVQRPEPVEAVAVPAAVIRIVLPLLEKLGRVPRAALGVTTKPLDAQLRAQLGLEKGGHLVERVDPMGPAHRAGLRRLDLIVGVNGAPMRPGTTLHDVLLPYRPRERVVVNVIRAGAPLKVPVTLGSR